MLNITIFALPLSSTHIIFSGLTIVSIIFLPFIIGDKTWLIVEMVLWAVSPIASVVLVLVIHSLIQKYIFQTKDARKRVLVFIPF